MENSNGSSNFRDFSYRGRQTLFSTQSPCQQFPSSSAGYSCSLAAGIKGFPKSTGGQRHHQHTASESFLLEEQPSWLEELLSEPETPLHKSHRRSSSDSFAFLETIAKVSTENDKYKNSIAGPCEFQCPEYRKHFESASSHKKPSFFSSHRNSEGISSANSVTNTSGLPSTRDSSTIPSSGSSHCSQETGGWLSKDTDRHEEKESGSHDREEYMERSDCSRAKPSASRTESKCPKQLYAQRSRVRKVQYIAELERNVQALEAEGSEIIGQLEFLDQQNLILGMENVALKQQLDSLSQERFIKYLEQQMLEAEIRRLQSLHRLQLQQQQQQHYSAHRYSKSKNLDSQFANLSLKQ